MTSHFCTTQINPGTEREREVAILNCSVLKFQGFVPGRQAGRQARSLARSISWSCLRSRESIQAKMSIYGETYKNPAFSFFSLQVFSFLLNISLGFNIKGRERGGGWGTDLLPPQAFRFILFII